MTSIPNDIRFGAASNDVTRDWCLSVAQPMASLLIAGRINCLFKSFPPPVAMVGRSFYIHAGQGDLPYKHFADWQRRAVQMELGRTLEAARRDLPKGQVLGKVRLLAANIVGAAGERVLYASPKAAHVSLAMGDWQDFDRFVDLYVGDAAKGRWVWWVDLPVAIEPEPLKGQSMLFDLEHARALRSRECSPLSSGEPDAAAPARSLVPPGSENGGAA